MGNAIRRLMLALCRERFIIHVHTGDRKWAGTGAHVTLRLRDTAGHVTRPTRLCQRFNHLQRGTVCRYPFPADPLLQELDSVVLRRHGAHLGDGWFVNLVEVEDTKRRHTWTFPVHRWIHNDTEYRVRQFDSSLPQDDDDDLQAVRRRELVQKRRQYQLVQNDGSGPVQVRGLPNDERFSFCYQLDLFVEQDSLQRKTCSIGSDTDNWRSFDELAKACNDSLGETMAMPHWTTDRWFGLQRVQGVNAVIIALCKDIPEKLGVDAAMLEPLLEGQTLQEALERSKIFIVDLFKLDGVKPVEGMQLCSPIALFFLNKLNQLTPLAIQLFQNKADDNPVFLQTDQPNLWLLAKMFYNNAEAQHHQSVTHLGFTHLLMDGVVGCTHRNLSVSHPVHRLMAPHHLCLLAINNLALQTLVSPGGWVDRNMTVGMDGMFDLIGRSLEDWRMDEHGRIPGQLAGRGVLDPAVLPEYPYRDDACTLHAIVERYVRTVLEAVYSSAEKLTGDWELQQWRRELTRPRQEGGVGLQGVAGDDDSGFSRVSEVVDVVTYFITTCSLGHAAANFAQYDEYGFVPNYPALLRGAPPASKSEPEPTEAELMAHLPSRAITRDIMIMTKLVSCQGTRNLGDFEVRYMYDPVGSQAAETLRSELRELTEAVKARNRTAEFPYQLLSPSVVPNSINV